MWLMIPPLLWTSYVAWRYAREPIDPDQALFMVWGFTGAPYGKGFADTKTPGIHLWYLLLTKIVGRSVPRVKFLHHFIIGATGSIIIFLYTGNFWMMMAWAVLINAGWLYAFHGNVGALPAVMILPVILGDNAWLSCFLMAVAVFVEPKMLPAAAFLGIRQGWWIPGMVLASSLLLFYLVTRRYKFWEYLWESAVTIPGRIAQARRKHGFYPWAPYFTVQPLLYVLPWVIAAVWSRTDLAYWLPPMLVMVFQATGKVIRPNHFLVIVPWIAVTPIPAAPVVALIAIDALTSGFYLGEIWDRFYRDLHMIVHDCMDAGLQIRDMPEGTFFAIGMYASCLYVWSQRPPYFPLVTNIEVREVAKERVHELKRVWKSRQPAFMARTPNAFLDFKPVGFVPMGESKHVKLWLRKSS